MNRIKELRQIKGINQLDLANLLGLSQQTISTYENNTREPDIKTIKTLSKHFNVSIDYLLGETEIQNRYEDAEKVIINLKEELNYNGYDLSEKSFEEIINIILMTLQFTKNLSNLTNN